MILLSIDPGAKGGIAMLKDNRVEVYKMPETPRDLCDVLEQVTRPSPTDACFSKVDMRCYVERVGGYVGNHHPEEDGIGGQPGSAMFKFGAGYGVIIGVLTALKVPFELIMPQVWQKGLNLGTKGLVKPTIVPGMDKEQKRVEFKRVSTINNRLKVAWKNKLKSLSQQLYPNIKVTLATSDCLLILEYARRRERLEQAKAPQGELL